MAGHVAGDLPADLSAVGADGCPAGWLATGVDGEGAWHGAVFESFDVLWGHLQPDRPGRILVDVPVGLPEDTVRECDERARDLLGCRWNSVFRTPIERAVSLKRREADDEDLRPRASAVNDAETGYGISVQAWNIADEIAEVDEFFDARGLDFDGPVREAHPELAFMAFNGQPVAYSKRSHRGRALRARILEDEGVPHDVPDELELSLEGTDVGSDDVLDAIVLSLAASGDPTTVPPDPDEDQPRIYFPDREPGWDDQSYFSG